MTPADAYLIYRDHCLDRGMTPPTREWWNATLPKLRKQIVFEPDFDIETERREGWAYDRS